MTLQEIHDWVFEDFGFCGCGDPDGALDFLKSVLLAVKKRHDDNDEGDQGAWNKNSEALRDLIGMETNPPMAWSYLYHLSDLDLLEHGGNCSGSWLTERGYEVLEALEKYGSNQIVNYEPGEDDVLNAVVVTP